MAKRKIQYHKDSGKLWQYVIDGVACSCKANVFHYEYDGNNIFVVCNGCKNDLTTIKDEYIAEELENGEWR